MTDIKRYGWVHMFGGAELPNGPWVSYADHEATLEALRAENDLLGILSTEAAIGCISRDVVIETLRAALEKIRDDYGSNPLSQWTARDALAAITHTQPEPTRGQSDEDA